MVRLAFVSLAGLALMSPGVSASEFLRSRGELQPAMRAAIESTLNLELKMDTVHLKNLEDELRPMFTALPKTEQGTLEPTAVRYALHRHFVHKHGWYVKGLEPAGQAWNTSAPTNAMSSRVPTFILSLFEQRLHGQGMGLHDLAVFTATLLDFVHNEALADIMDMYSAFGLPTSGPAASGDIDKVVKAYTLQFIDINNTIRSMRNLRETEQYMLAEFPAYEDFQVWVEDVRKTKELERSRSKLVPAEFSLESTVEEIIELNDRIGAFQDIECRRLKNGLAELEYKNTGRVLLNDFYREGMTGDFLFNEHIDFLRKLGALDQTDPAHPSIIIANYLASQANCLASTSFHSVCCIDECEGLLSSLERKVAAPSASPGRVAELVSNLPSDTIDAPRNLSAELLSRLGEIAEQHDGVVPLHGRLFAQWMHHVYPLECPFPHVAGSWSAITADEWMDEFGANEVMAPEPERLRLMQKDLLAPRVDVVPWMPLEELVVDQRHARNKGYRVLRIAAAILGLAAWAVPVTHAWKSFTTGGLTKQDKSHLV